MKYAVLGTGMVGHTLANKLIALGHEVRMGARSEDNPKAAEWAKTNGEKAGHGTYGEVARWAEMIVFAVNGARLLDVAKAVGEGAVVGKTLIDVTNPLDMSNGMPPTLIPEMSNTTSAGEELQRTLPGARVVKTLNTMNHQLMVDPARLNGAHDVFLCGDAEEAKADVVELLKEFGWQNPIDLGKLEAARGMEGMMPFWLRMWGVNGNADFNYRIVTS